MNHFAWIGTGQCEPGVVFTAQLFQFGTVVAAILTIAWLIRDSKQKGLLKKATIKLLLAVISAVIVIGAALIVLIIALGAVCRDWDGLFF